MGLFIWGAFFFCPNQVLGEIWISSSDEAQGQKGVSLP